MDKNTVLLKKSSIKSKKPNDVDKLEKKQLAEEQKRIKPGECLKVNKNSSSSL